MLVDQTDGRSKKYFGNHKLKKVSKIRDEVKISDVHIFLDFKIKD